MQPVSSEISRDDLLAFLRREGFRVSAHQLLRWHDWGLLPQPRRVGLGRGRGTTSYYPRTAAGQARALAALLRKKRNLVEAGWGLWVLGFPITDWARDLLLYELKIQRGQAKRASKSLASDRSQLFRLLSRQRPPRELLQMRKAAGAKAMPRLFRMMVEFQLGTLREKDYSEDEWAGFQDASLHQLIPEIVDDPGLPSASEVASGLAKLSPQISLDRTIAGLAKLSGARLEQYRNEAQWLLERMLPPEAVAEACIGRDDFVSFFKARHLNPEGEREIGSLMRALGQTHPPASPLQRWIAAQRAITPRPSATSAA